MIFSTPHPTSAIQPGPDDHEMALLRSVPFVVILMVVVLVRRGELNHRLRCALCTRTLLCLQGNLVPVEEAADFISELEQLF
jgi:hypothetical protein